MNMYKSWKCTNHEYAMKWLHSKFSDATKGFSLYWCMSGSTLAHTTSSSRPVSHNPKKILCLGLLFWLGLGTQEADWPCCPCSFQTAATYTNKVWPSTSVNNAVIACCHSNTRMSPAPFLPWLLLLEFPPAETHAMKWPVALFEASWSLNWQSLSVFVP